MPISRLTTCLDCRADLHVCRLCRYYDPRIRGECLHERAERIVDKTLANFCTYFRPMPDAFHEPGRSAADDARTQLESLFGTAATSAETEAPEDEAPSAAERARAELDSLFGTDDEQPT